VKIPDYISPVVGYRVWQWDADGLKSLNGEVWFPRQQLSAICKADASGRISGLKNAAHRASELPYFKCTCGIYAARTVEHIRQWGYGKFAVQGEVYLWGRVVEHERGWRAEFAYPKSFLLVLNMLPFLLSQLHARLKSLIAFGTDIFILRDGGRVPLWRNGSGYDATGVDYLINWRKGYYVRHGSDRTLRKGDRVALVGRGIAVVEETDDKNVGLVLGNKQTLRVARKDIALNEHNMRWECRSVLDEPCHTR
jgi:hypothetical protein